MSNEVVSRVLARLQATNEPKDSRQGKELPDEIEGQGLLFQMNDKVTYTIPDPMGTGPHPAWVEHTGKVLHVDSVGQAVCLQPEDEPGTPWRWLWWGYARKVSDGQAS